MEKDQILYQPLINVGVIGHVAHGKSTFVRNISGTKTQRHSSELTNNKTIYLGYANTKIYRCDECVAPVCFATTPVCSCCNGATRLVNHLSFVDCPGHDELMATMLNGVAMMDYVILVIAANEEFPRPQTLEHFMAAKMMNVDNLIVIQNKVDLVSQTQAVRQYEDIVDFMARHDFHQPVVIPFVGHGGCNRQVVLHHLAELVIPKRHLERPVRMFICRSFDINAGQTQPDKIKGGVIGGTIVEGCLKPGDNIEIKPGIIFKNRAGNYENIPVQTRVIALQTDRQQLNSAYPGGLIGVETNLDPYLTQKNRIVGQVAGIPGTLPGVFTNLVINYKRLDRDGPTVDIGDEVRLNINSGTVYGDVFLKKGKRLTVSLKAMCCVDLGQGVAVSKRDGSAFRLVGYGTVKSLL